MRGYPIGLKTMHFQRERLRFYFSYIEIVVSRKECKWSVYIMRYLAKGVSILGIFDGIIRSVVSLFIMQYVLCVSCNIRIVGIIVSM